MFCKLSMNRSFTFAGTLILQMKDQLSVLKLLEGEHGTCLNKSLAHQSSLDGFIQGNLSRTMYPLTRDLLFVILQFFYESNMQESAQKLEQESKVYFNIERFNSMIISAKWDAAENYLRSFTSPEDNRNSVTIFWVIRKQKYLEALDEHNILKALSIFHNELTPLRREKTDKTELGNLLPLNNFRENHKYSNFGNTETMRKNLVVQLVNLLKTNPKTFQKIHFPHIERSRLNNLLAQSFKWQHYLCQNAVENPQGMMTLFTDHVCERPSSSASHQPLNLNWLRNTLRNAQDNGSGPTPQGGATNSRNLWWRG